MPSGTVERWIRSNSQQWVNRYVYCSFDNFTGLVYNEFDINRHFIPKFELPQRTVPYYDLSIGHTGLIEYDCNFYMGLDFGRDHPTAAIYIAVLPPDERGIQKKIIIDEYKVPGKLPEQHAEALKFYEKKNNIVNIQRVIDSRATSEGKISTGVSIREQYAKCGLHFQLARRDKMGALTEIARWFRNDELFIFNHNYKTLDEITEYSWKEYRSAEQKQEETEKINDDLMDCIWFIATLSPRYTGYIDYQEIRSAERFILDERHRKSRYSMGY